MFVENVGVVMSKIGDAWYYLKCKFWHKYNTVTATALPPTYIDRCELIRHSMFQILTDFLEKEDPFKYHIKFTFTAEQEEKNENNWVTHMKEKSETYLSMLRLYNWYWDIYAPHCKDSVKAHDKAKNTTCVLMHKGNECIEDDSIILGFKCQYCSSYWNSHHDYDEELNQIVLEKMKELVELSPCMWT